MKMIQPALRVESLASKGVLVQGGVTFKEFAKSVVTVTVVDNARSLVQGYCIAEAVVTESVSCGSVNSPLVIYTSGFGFDMLRMTKTADLYSSAPRRRHIGQEQFFIGGHRPFY